ncbi:diacylglycerol kinase family protein [Muriicola sp. E247]|uniref:diacylglycerol kinase family protein n=1 Tax=unclassified Muriicola TaxID=2647561 RepID=UPI0035106F9A
MNKESFVMNRVKGFIYAVKGAFLLLRTESSIQIQFVIAVLITAAGFYYQISTTEWILQTLAIGLVMGVEGVNTAIEKLSDYIQPNLDPKIGFIKDISAGAVMLAAIAATIVGLIIYIPRIF